MDRSLPSSFERNSALRRLIAISSMMATLMVSGVILVIILYIRVFNPTLGKESFLLPVTGVLFILGTILAVTGIFSGISELIHSKGQRGLIVISVVVNTIYCWSLLGFSIFGMTGQL